MLFLKEQTMSRYDSGSPASEIENQRNLAWYDEYIMYQLYHNEGMKTSEIISQIPSLTPEKFKNEIEKLENAGVAFCGYITSEGDIYSEFVDAVSDGLQIERYAEINDTGVKYLRQRGFLDSK